MSDSEPRQHYVQFTTQTFATNATDAIQIALDQISSGAAHATVTTDTPGEITEIDHLANAPFSATPARNEDALKLKANDHTQQALEILSSRVNEMAPGYYTERDGGDWYCVAPNGGGRFAEDFSRRTDALRMILWLAGDPLPEGWVIGYRSRGLSLDVECRQGYTACIWKPNALVHFPARKATLTTLLPI